MDTGYKLAKSLTGTLWEPDFLEIVHLTLMDLLEV
jgi:hypothetical protein